MDIEALARGFAREATTVQVCPSIPSPNLVRNGKELARGNRGRILCLAIEIQHEILNLCAGPDVEVCAERVERIVLGLRRLQCIVGTQVEVIVPGTIDIHRLVDANEGAAREGNRRGGIGINRYSR